MTMKQNGKVYRATSMIQGDRKNQQDCLTIQEKSTGELLAVVCDGMGGLQGGELASTCAVNFLRKDFREVADIVNIPTFLYNAVVKSDEAVYHLQDTDGNLLAAGSTIVAVMIKGKHLYYISVGDSRIYLIRNHRMVRITQHDHNYRYRLDKALENKEITIDKYKEEEKYAEALISYLGMCGLELVSYNSKKPIELLNGDCVLLCSDGLYKSLTDEQIAAIILDTQFAGLDIAASRLTSEAFASARDRRKRQDNTSVVLLTYRE